MMVSVIIPVYNVEKYIKRCLQSVVSQSYQDLELILVDDCGTDCSIAVAETFLSMIPNLAYRIERHFVNQGLSEARNTGLRVASGEYIYFLDSDDWLPKNALEKLIRKAKETQAVCVVGEYSECVDTTAEVLSVPYRYGKSMSFVEKKNIITFFCGKELPVTAWNKLVRREFLLKNKLYFEKGIYHEDCLWTFQLISLLPSLAVLSDSTYCYSVNPNSIMNQLGVAKIQKRIDSSLIVLDKMKETVNGLIGVPKIKMLLYIDEMRTYMCRKLLVDGASRKKVKSFFETSYAGMSWERWHELPLKMKIVHFDQILPKGMGFCYFMFLYKCIFSR